MFIPPGYTEDQVLEAIEKTVAILAPSFVFGYYDVDDIRQHGRLVAIEVLATEKFDPTRPLENFLYRHIRNRYINLIRDKFRRNDPPCRACANGTYCDPDGPCEKYVAWVLRNAAKSNLVCPLGIDHISDEREPRTRVDSTVEDDVATSELLRLLDEKLPVALRQYFLQMRDGVSIPKNKRRQVEAAVREILEVDVPWRKNEDD